MVAIIGMVAVVYAGLIAMLLRLGRPWLNPMFFILVCYTLNYPVRACLLLEFPDTFNTYQLSEDDILFGLTYSTCYVLVFVSAFLTLARTFRIRFDAIDLPPATPLELRFFNVVTLLVLVSGVVTIGYEVAVEGMFSGAADIEGLRRPLWVNVAGLPYSLKALALCLGCLLLVVRRSASTLLSTTVLVALILAEAVLSTSKGLVAGLVMLLLFVDNLLTGRFMRAAIVVPGLLAGVVFATYSYYARYSGGAGLGSFSEYADFAGAFFQADLLQIFDERMVNIVDRVTYYLDAIPLIARNVVSTHQGAYAFGSLVELANLFPRGLEIFPEQYSFDRHVTQVVWAEVGFSQIFIGRIGESYFVLGFAGLAYAVLHALIFAAVAAAWSHLSRSLGGIALYFALLLGWLYQDASLLYQIKAALAIVFGYLLIREAAGWTLRPAAGAPPAADTESAPH